MPLLNGIEAARQLRRVCPKSKLLLLTMHTEDSYVLEALRAGIQGYILKSRAATELIQAIQQVCQGKMYLSPGVSQTVVEAYLAKTDVPPEPLTHREREVLQLVAEGKTTKEVAQFLGVSVKTAESHRMNIMQKLDIHETANLVRYAIRRGLIEP
jgi:DNA-binding NarL/FixJ family response regulator